MKQATVNIPLSSFILLGGSINAGAILYCKPLYKDVIFVEFVKNEHDDVLVKWKIDGLNVPDLPITINDFMINTGIVLKSQVEDVVTRAYNMGAFSGNSMARAIYKDVECLTLEEFLKQNV
jgi:hypothetical protein